MSRVHVFIDGTWLWHNVMTLNQTVLRQLSKTLNKKVKLNIGLLPSTLINRLDPQLILTKTILTASLPVNVNYRDTETLSKRQHFFHLLRDEYQFTLDLYSIDFHGHRLCKKDRQGVNWEPKEKCVDISLATNLLYYANDYDQAIVITGDKDFTPAIEKAIKMGKKLRIASFRSSCHSDLEKYPIFWLDDLVKDLLLE